MNTNRRRANKIILLVAGSIAALFVVIAVAAGLASKPSPAASSTLRAATSSTAPASSLSDLRACVAAFERWAAHPEYTVATVPRKCWHLTGPTYTNPQTGVTLSVQQLVTDASVDHANPATWKP
jgi:hypothetical protein